MKVLIDQDLNVDVILTNINSSVVDFTVAVEDYGISVDENGEIIGDMNGEIVGTNAKDPLLSGWPFVIGISALTLAVSIGLGILLAKRKIKKGFELYED